MLLPASGPSWTPWGWCWLGRTGCCSRSWWRGNGMESRRTPTASKTIIRGFKLNRWTTNFFILWATLRFGCCCCYGSLWQSRKEKENEEARMIVLLLGAHRLKNNCCPQNEKSGFFFIRFIFQTFEECTEICDASSTIKLVHEIRSELKRSSMF